MTLEFVLTPESIENSFRDAMIYQIWVGTAEIRRLVISRAITGQRATIRLR